MSARPTLTVKKVNTTHLCEEVFAEVKSGLAKMREPIPTATGLRTLDLGYIELPKGLVFLDTWGYLNEGIASASGGHCVVRFELTFPPGTKKIPAGEYAHVDLPFERVKSLPVVEEVPLDAFLTNKRTSADVWNDLEEAGLVDS